MAAATARGLTLRMACITLTLTSSGALLQPLATGSLRRWQSPPRTVQNCPARCMGLSMSADEADSGRRKLIFGGLFNGPGGIKVGDNVVAGNDWNSSSPAFGIIRAQSYTLKRVYYQGVSDGTVERVDVEALDATPPPGCAGYAKFMCLYSSRYHADTGPVVLSPTEVEVVRMKDEITESAWLALPGLFWVWLAYTFWRYGEDNGGAFRGLQKPAAPSQSAASDELAAALEALNR